jgi:hypothetical protein
VDAVLRLTVAVLIGAVVFGVVVWAVRLVAYPPPATPDPDDLVEVHRDYRCTVCGMRLTVTLAAGEESDAPRHCGESMEQVAPDRPA